MGQNLGVSTEGDSQLSGSSFLISAQGIPCLYPDLLGSMREFVFSMERQRESGVALELIGPEGAGRQTLAAQLAGEFGADLLAVDARLHVRFVPPTITFGESSGSVRPSGY